MRALNWRTAITINDCGLQKKLSRSAIRNRYSRSLFLFDGTCSHKLIRCRSAIVIAVLLFPTLLSAEENTAAQHYQSGLAYERLGRLDESYTELQLASNLDNGNS